MGTVMMVVLIQILDYSALNMGGSLVSKRLVGVVYNECSFEKSRAKKSPEIIEAVSSVSGIVEIPIVANICRTRTEVEYTSELWPSSPSSSKTFTSIGRQINPFRDA